MAEYRLTTHGITRQLVSTGCAELEAPLGFPLKFRSLTSIVQVGSRQIGVEAGQARGAPQKWLSTAKQMKAEMGRKCTHQEHAVSKPHTCQIERQRSLAPYHHHNFLLRRRCRPCRTIKETYSSFQEGPIEAPAVCKRFAMTRVTAGKRVGQKNPSQRYGNKAACRTTRGFLPTSPNQGSPTCCSSCNLISRVDAK